MGIQRWVVAIFQEASGSGTGAGQGQVLEILVGSAFGTYTYVGATRLLWAALEMGVEWVLGFLVGASQSSSESALSCWKW